MPTKKVVSKKPLKATKKVPAKKAPKPSVAKSRYRGEGEQTFTITVSATALMWARLEIEAGSLEEAEEKAEEMCKYGGIADSVWDIREMIEGPEVV